MSELKTSEECVGRGAEMQVVRSLEQAEQKDSVKIF